MGNGDLEDATALRETSLFHTAAESCEDKMTARSEKTTNREGPS